ncbi:unnamed protein product [Macrosiphum euphorbiae]|uniref:Uncharacterized protein n=1 Tax=Macrosiphum euphorbiae TaxID=13131 RepID=A0AAV0WF00_9HEMI|nr:unnamed protein product [Macrosiphum euphorbiae]
MNNNDSDLDDILCLNSDDEDEHINVDLNGSNIIEDSNDEMNNINEPSTSTGIKRKKRNRSLWNRNVEKKKRSEGIEFIGNYKNKVLKKRQIGMDCKCPLNYFSKFNEEEKNKTIDILNSMGSKEKQDTYVCALITVNKIVRRRSKTGDGPTRSCSCKFKIRINIRD